MAVARSARPALSGCQHNDEEVVMKWFFGLLAIAGLSGCIAVPILPPPYVHAGPPRGGVVVAPVYPGYRGYRDDRQRWRYP
jgi:hypothetical protein